MNFQFSIVKKLWDLAQENLVHIQGSYSILNIYSWMSALYPKHCHLKSASLKIEPLQYIAMYCDGSIFNETDVKCKSAQKR